MKTFILLTFWLLCITILSFCLNEPKTEGMVILFWFIISILSTVLLYIHCEVKNMEK